MARAAFAGVYHQFLVNECLVARRDAAVGVRGKHVAHVIANAAGKAEGFYRVEDKAFEVAGIDLACGIDRCSWIMPPDKLAWLGAEVGKFFYPFDEVELFAGHFSSICRIAARPMNSE